MQTFTSHFLFHPPKHDPSCKFRTDSRNCMLRSVNGDSIHCHLVCPWDQDTNIDAHVCTPQVLLFLHGNSEDVATSMSYCQWLADTLKCNVLSCDYPGYGFSTGMLCEEGMNSAAFAVLDFAVGKLNYAVQDIVVIGKSIGSTPAIHIASMSFCSSLGGLVLVSPVASAVRCLSASHQMPEWLLSKLDCLVLPNIKHIANVSCPVQFVHGTKDTVVPCKNTDDLMAAMRTPQRTKPLFIAAGHNDIESLFASEYLSTLRSFLLVCAQRATTDYDTTNSRIAETCLFDI